MAGHEIAEVQGQGAELLEALPDRCAQNRVVGRRSSGRFLSGPGVQAAANLPAPI
jgi:hypothetical protein